MHIGVRVVGEFMFDGLDEHPVHALREQDPAPLLGLVAHWGFASSTARNSAASLLFASTWWVDQP